MPDVKILCRVRPPINKEERVVFAQPDKGSVIVSPGEEYCYDVVFGEKSKSCQIYETIKELSSPEHDCAVVLYGPTNAGKTTTLMGILKPFLEEFGTSTMFQAMEIYNGKTKILMSKTLLTTANSKSTLKNAMAKRSVGATSANSTSSRSHVILTFWLKGNSMMTFVDLAGCERLEQSGNDPIRRAEAIHVNKALTALRDVVEGIAKKNDYIPYRNSKLTLTLKEHLRTDNSQFIMILCCNHHRLQTTETLRFGRTATKMNKCEVPTFVEEESNTEPPKEDINYKEAYESSERQLYILRQALAAIDVSSTKVRRCSLCNRIGHNRRTCLGIPLPPAGQDTNPSSDELQK